VTPNEPLANTKGAGVFFVGSIHSLQGGKTVKTVRIPKRKLLFAALAVVAIIGVALVVIDIKASSGDSETNTADKAAADSPPPSAGITLTEAEVDAVTTAAGQALSEIMSLDHAEGQEAWEARIEPLCTENGLAFWTGPMFGDQVWPMVIEREYTTQEIEVINAKVINGGESPDSIIVEVTLTLTYVLGESDDPIQEESVNQVVMVKESGHGPDSFQGESPDGLSPVNQDGDWLTDGPPSPSYWSGEK
jgi:hypothetical protein